MRWRKLGLVYMPDGSQWWARHYAHLPTAEVVTDGLIRIYFASLDEQKRGRIGFVDVETKDPTKAVAVSEKPVLDVGEPGCFDDSGVNPSSLIGTDLGNCLYYIGWQRSERVPYLLFAGIAVRQGDGTFRRFSRAPVLERSNVEPFLRSATTILRDGNRYRCWYVAGRQWIEVGGRPYPEYVIKHIASADGIHWAGDGQTCIDFESPSEFGFGRPWVVRENGKYIMWYSIRSRTEPYQMGYAESHDGLHWTRLDRQVGLTRSESGWDSEMVCYPSVVTSEGRQLMFYNGNSHGASGFGVAIREA